MNSWRTCGTWAAAFALSGQILLHAPGPASTTASRAAILEAATDIMRLARYCTLVTIGADGHPQARIVDPFAPEDDLTIWIATNPLTRKIEDIRRDPRVTLLYFNQSKSEYVTVLGTARIETNARIKAAHWKPEWSGLYKNENRGDDFLLVRVQPTRLEVSSVERGLKNDEKTWRPLIVELPR
jgi:general stress protein 26